MWELQGGVVDYFEAALAYMQNTNMRKVRRKLRAGYSRMATLSFPNIRALMIRKRLRVYSHWDHKETNLETTPPADLQL